MKQSLIQTAWEYEGFKITARDELKKKDEEIQRLFHLLKVACQERDEAREQLHLLMLNKFMPHTAHESIPIASYLQSESPRLRQQQLTRGGNSSTTAESDSISDTRNHQSYASSPVDSFFDPETSPELSNTNIACYNYSSSPTSVVGVSVPLIQKYDQASARLEQLVSKRPLPEKGKLMDAVMKAGPLLQSLMVAGPLPRWKNPPPLQQLQIPPVSVKGRNCQTLNQTAALSPNVVHSPINPLHKETLLQGGSLMHGAAMKRSIVSTACSPVKKLKSQ